MQLIETGKNISAFLGITGGTLNKIKDILRHDGYLFDLVTGCPPRRKLAAFDEGLIEWMKMKKKEFEASLTKGRWSPVWNRKVSPNPEWQKRMESETRWVESFREDD
jgi:hypothetical protein